MLIAEMTNLKQEIIELKQENIHLKRLVEDKEIVIDSLLDWISRFRQQDRLSDRGSTLRDEVLPSERSCSSSSVSSFSLCPYHSRRPDQMLPSKATPSSKVVRCAEMALLLSCVYQRLHDWSILAFSTFGLVQTPTNGFRMAY
ncbi:unnamed protein product [Cylicostephanus goldi]|uniref:Uncharacterized protein n=1 Tax=Cylicostephanus goldi TaxID=71465 RepID=A0A3P6S5L5_CYLGO|nr:unnamed protein product [Cylicostephanus goldi]